MFWDSYVIYEHFMNIICTFHIFMYGYVTSYMPSNMVNRHDEWIQILDEAVCISHSANTLWNSKNPIILPQTMGK